MMVDLSESERAFLVACIETSTSEGGPYGEGWDGLNREQIRDLFRKLKIDENSWFF